MTSVLPSVRSKTLLLAGLAVVTLIGMAAGWLLYRSSGFSERVPLSRVGVCLCKADRDLILRRGTLQIAASLYGSDAGQRHPAVLLVHGNTPQGRRLPAYEVLATGMAARGYLVMTIDLTGFGESDDPLQLADETAADNRKDVDTALQYLGSMPEADPERIYVVGHSRGASGAVRAGIESDAVRKMVAIGPPRRVNRRFANPMEVQYFWERKRATYRKVYGQDLPGWYTKELWLRQVLDTWPMEHHLDYFTRPGHKPLLLLDGALEDKADLDYLAEYHNRIREPKAYVTIPLADHYSNTGRFWFLNFYDRTVMDRTVTLIAEWLDSDGGSVPTDPGMTPR